MKIQYTQEYNPKTELPIYKAVITELDDPRYYSKDAPSAIAGTLMGYGKYHGGSVIITHEKRRKIEGLNMDRTCIQYGKKKQDVLSWGYYHLDKVYLLGLYRGSYADILITKTLWEEIKAQLFIEG